MRDPMNEWVNFKPFSSIYNHISTQSETPVESNKRCTVSFHFYDHSLFFQSICIITVKWSLKKILAILLLNSSLSYSIMINLSSIRPRNIGQSSAKSILPTFMMMERTDVDHKIFSLCKTHQGSDSKNRNKIDQLNFKRSICQCIERKFIKMMKLLKETIVSFNSEELFPDQGCKTGSRSNGSYDWDSMPTNGAYIEYIWCLKQFLNSTSLSSSYAPDDPWK